MNLMKIQPRLRLASVQGRKENKTAGRSPPGVRTNIKH